jgi:hypothetical protein
MKQLTSLLLFLLLPIFVFAEPVSPKETTWVQYSYFGGMRYTFAISNAKYAAMRTWNPSLKTAPPVTPQRALELSKARLALIKIPPHYYWRVEQIALEPIGLTGDKWMYVVHFRYAWDSAMTGVWPTMRFLVTMDGDLIEPEIDPEKLEH